MGNCLQALFAGVRSRRRSSRNSRDGSTQREEPMSFTNPAMVQLPQNSPYVSQLYAANIARQRAAEGEMKVMDESRRLRLRGLLEQIPADVFRSDMKTSECAICMIDFEEGDSIRFLPCMHSFHQDCVDDWLMRSFTCPSCMEPVDSTILSSLTAHMQQQTYKDLTRLPVSSNQALAGSSDTAQNSL